MNANPSACAHRNLTYDGTFRIVRCLDCDTTWDADEPIPVDMRDPRDAAHGATWKELAELKRTIDIITNDPQFHKPRLNPDNDPNSEHNQWKEEDDDTH